MADSESINKMFKVIGLHWKSSSLKQKLK